MFTYAILSFTMLASCHVQLITCYLTTLIRVVEQIVQILLQIIYFWMRSVLKQIDFV